MHLHDQTTTARRDCKCSTVPNLVILCALLLAVSVAGCERGMAPFESRDSSPASPRPDAVPEPPDAPTQPPVSEPDADSDAPPPAAAPDLPTPTTGESSADSTRNGGDQPILRAVRIGQQPGMDRLVFEFDGAGLPAWRVEYVDRPVRDCGSGEPVPVAGDAWLQIHFVGAQAHTEAGEGTSGPRRRTVDQTVLRELVRTCDFEGHVTWVAGVASPNPYTLRTLAAPSRLVIDIVH